MAGAASALTVRVANVAEISYYVDENHQHQGIGKQLIAHALQEAPKCGLHNLFAILLDINQVSIALLEKNDFTLWGHLPDIAEFPDGICGQFIYGRKVYNYYCKVAVAPPV